MSSEEEDLRKIAAGLAWDYEGNDITELANGIEAALLSERQKYVAEIEKLKSNADFYSIIKDNKKKDKIIRDFREALKNIMELDYSDTRIVATQALMIADEVLEKHKENRP